MEREKFLQALTSLKRFSIKGIIVVGLFATACFIFSRTILSFLLKAVNIKVYYFSFPEVFFSSVELAIYAGVFCSLPVLVFLIWFEFKDLIKLNASEKWLFAVSSIVLFYAGSIFCYSIVLQSGIKFLLGYEGDVLKAMISVERFVKFASAMIFAFGLTFEVPVVLIALNKMGIVKVKMLTRTRRFAVLFITIASAIITPTPDLYNMMLLAVPTYILYEISIIIMKISEKKRENGY